MNRFIEWFSKTRMLFVSFIGAILAIFFWFFINDNTLDSLVYASFVFIPIMLFSTIVYFLSESTFSSWRKFTFIYLFIYLFVMIVAPLKCDAYIPLCKTKLFFLFIPTYFILSIILILYTSFKLKTPPKQ